MHRNMRVMSVALHFKTVRKMIVIMWQEVMIVDWMMNMWN